MPKTHGFRPSRSSFSGSGQGTSPAVGQTRIYFSPGSQQPTAGAFLLLRVTKDQAASVFLLDTPLTSAG